MAIDWIKENWLEIFGVITTLIYLYLEIKQKPQMWIWGFFSSLIYVFVFFFAKIYADMMVYIYYVFISIYGFFLWEKSKHVEQSEIKIEADKISYINLKLPLTVILLGVSVGIYFLLVYVLTNYTDSPVPYKDSFATALSVVATWMLAKKIIQHWFLWILINFFSVYLFYTRHLYITSGLFVIYGIVSVIGYFNWKKQGVLLRNVS